MSIQSEQFQNGRSEDLKSELTQNERVRIWANNKYGALAGEEEDEQGVHVKEE